MKLKLNMGHSIPLNFINKIAIILVLTVAVTGLTAYYFIIPSTKQIIQINKEIEAKKTDLELKYVKGNDTSKLSQDMDSIKEWEPAIDKSFFKKNDELHFITELEKIASANHIEQKINLGQPKAADKPGFYVSSLDLQSTGRFFDLMNYLKALESADNYININNLSLTPVSNDSRTARAKNTDRLVTIKIYSNYYLKD